MMSPGRVGLSKSRAVYLDLFKTVLTVGMVLAHVIQLIDRTPGRFEHGASIYLNFITFSGFMFAFGIGVGLSYRTGRPRTTMASRGAAPLLLFIAYCISSFASIGLAGGQRLGGTEILDVVLLRRLYAYSEFLATFFLLSLVTSFMRPLVIRICDNGYLLLALGMVSTILTVLHLSPPDAPLIGALIGSYHYASFPLLQYMPWFLLGVYFSRHDMRLGPMAWTIASAATLAFVAYVALYRSMPPRFPPHVLWIAGPALVLFAYLRLCQIATQHVSMAAWMTHPGRHVLRFLVASNVTLFAVMALVGKTPMNFGGAVACTAALMVPVGIAGHFWDRRAATARHRCTRTA